MQLKLHMVAIEDLVPQEHFLRKLETVLDLSFVYAETENLYSRKTGRPPIDPVILLKYLLVGYLYGIPSERQIEQRIQTDAALQWYLGLDLFDRVPDHSTISQLRRRKPSWRKIFRRLFEKVVEQCISKGLVSGRLVAADSTHVKANASIDSEEDVDVPGGPGAYWERLDVYEEEAALELERRCGKRHRKRTRQINKSGRRTRKRISHTDPDAGHMARPGKPSGPHYLSHQTVDTDYGIILDVTVTGGDVNDSTPYLDQIERIHRSIIPVQMAAADSAYDISLAHRVLADMGIALFVPPQPRPSCPRSNIKRKAFVYDAEHDVYICPAGKPMRVTNLQRGASGLYWPYRADKKDCLACPLRGQCMTATGYVRTVQHSYFLPSVQENRSRYDSIEYTDALRKRRIWCEGTFAAQKREHNLTSVQ